MTRILTAIAAATILAGCNFATLSLSSRGAELVGDVLQAAGDYDDALASAGLERDRQGNVTEVSTRWYCDALDRDPERPAEQVLAWLEGRLQERVIARLQDRANERDIALVVACYDTD